ncbi:hypothetical protein ACIBG0_37110 [Nocardia sp. NPDC050630]|uniref:hypothetical protein n=1 Tax=Nocardia sp. NPDC050630 TaxID=3364321 RepID=UPI0037AB9022
MSLTLVDLDKMQSSGGQTAYRHGELKAHLGALADCQVAFQTAYKGMTGNAIQSVLDDVLKSGNDLATFLQTIIDDLHAAGVQFDSSQQDTKGMIDGAAQDGSSKINLAGI